MKMLKQIKSKSLLILVAAILILCGGFVIISCGTGPQQKVELLDTGPYAIDFSSASASTTSEANVGAVWILKSLAQKDLPSLADTEFTIEAMIKSKATTLNGGIFSQYDSGGVIMWVADNELKFGIRIPTTGTSNDPSDKYTVSSGDTTVATDEWTHVAGVLVNAAHSHTATTSCTAAAMAETPHLDIYVNGQFNDCASTGSQYAVAPTYDINKERIGIGQLIATKPYGYGEYTKTDFDVDYSYDEASYVDIATRFEGIIDEVRLWTVARTATEIQNCWNKELGIDGNCVRDDNILKGYWRFNENKGALIHDFSGNVFNGSKKEIAITIPINDTNQSNNIMPTTGYPSTTPTSWNYGWVTGYPF